MSAHDLENSLDAQGNEGFMDTVAGLRYSLAGLADDLDDYIGRVRSFLPVVAKHDLSPHDSLPDLYAAAVSLLYTTEEHMGRIASNLAVIEQHPALFLDEDDDAAEKVTISEADLYVSGADGSIARPCIVTVADQQTCFIKSATVQEAHDGKE